MKSLNGAPAPRHTCIFVHTKSAHLRQICHAFYFLLGVAIGYMTKFPLWAGTRRWADTEGLSQEWWVVYVEVAG